MPRLHRPWGGTPLTRMLRALSHGPQQPRLNCSLAPPSALLPSSSHVPTPIGASWSHLWDNSNPHLGSLFSGDPKHDSVSPPVIGGDPAVGARRVSCPWAISGRLYAAGWAGKRGSPCTLTLPPPVGFLPAPGRPSPCPTSWPAVGGAGVGSARVCWW